MVRPIWRLPTIGWFGLLALLAAGCPEAAPTSRASTDAGLLPTPQPPPPASPTGSKPKPDTDPPGDPTDRPTADVTAASVSSASAPLAPATTVTVTGPPRAVSGVRIVVHDGTGGIDTTHRTDRKGRVVFRRWDVAMVTALLGADERHPVTMTRIRPGDTISFRSPVASEQSPDPVDVTLPADAPSGTDAYRVSAGCGEVTSAIPGATLPVSAPAHCRNPGRGPSLLAYATSAGEPVAYATEPAHLPYTEVDSVELGPWQTDWTEIPYHIRNTNSSALDWQATLWFERPNLHGRFGRQVLTENTGYYRYPTGEADSIHYRAGFASGDGQSTARISTMLHGRMSAGGGSSISVDLSRQLLPLISRVGVYQTETRRPLLNWELSGPARGLDAGVATLTWKNADGVPHRWRLAFPGGRQSELVFPELPSSAPLWTPDSADSVRVGLRLTDLLADETYGQWIEPHAPSPDSTPGPGPRRVTSLGYF